MVDSLAATLSQLRLDVQHLSGPAFDARIAEEENDTFENHRPRKRSRHDKEDLKADLEREFLTPSPTFSPDWLNRLQRSARFMIALFVNHLFFIIIR